MIEIIIEKVVMPPLDDCKFIKVPKDCNGNKWGVINTEISLEIYKGKFEEASLICYNLNKKYYRDNKPNQITKS